MVPVSCGLDPKVKVSERSVGSRIRYFFLFGGPGLSKSSPRTPGASCVTVQLYIAGKQYSCKLAGDQLL